GRPLVVRFGDARGSYDDFFVVFRGTARNWHVDEQTLRINIRDFGYRLEAPVGGSIYGGTGGVDGGDDLKGKRKPRLFGLCLNITPAFVSSAALLYQVNDGPVQEIDDVYVRGAALGFDRDYASSAL